MAIIYPFRAIHFNEKVYPQLKNLLCPPYDILTQDQKQIYLNANMYNMIRLESPDGNDKYNSSAKLMTQMLNKKLLIQDDIESIYLYEQDYKFNGEIHKFRGFFCTVQLEPFSKRIILPHEQTLSQPKEDRLQIMKATSCNISPVCSLCDIDDNIKKFLKEAFERTPTVITTCLKGHTHKLWQIKDKTTINKIILSLKTKKLYIADGHHRYETALIFQKEHPKANKILMLISDINESGMVVLPTHRIVETSISEHLIINLCKKNFYLFDVLNFEQMDQKMILLKQKNLTCFGLYLGNNKWKVMSTRKYSNIPSSQVLHSKILSPISQKSNVIFERDPSQCIKMVDNKTNSQKICFFLNSTKVSDVIKASNQGKLLPEKSTYFFPKIITGLVINKLF